MARGDLYLSNFSDTWRLYLSQTIRTDEITGCATLVTEHATHGGVQSITRTFNKNPIIIPLPDSEPLGIDINFIESDTIRINTMWFDGIGDDSTYYKAEQFFSKIEPATVWTADEKMKPYKFQMGERQYHVMLTSWTADLTGGWGDTVPVTLSLSIVASPGT